jgi:hypothetical protein
VASQKVTSVVRPDFEGAATQSRHDPQTFGHPRSSLKNKIAEERFQGRWRSLKTLRALSHRSESAVLLCESAVLAMCPAARARAARFYCSYQLSIPS